MSLFEGMERSEGMIKAVPAAPEKYLIDFFYLIFYLSSSSILLIFSHTYHLQKI